MLEILVNNGRIQSCIIEAEKTAEIYEIIREGAYYGMQTFDQHLFALLTEGTISLKEGMRLSSKPADFRLMIQNAGLVATEQLASGRVGM